MSVAGRTTTGKVWHVAVWAVNPLDHQTGRWVALCGALSKSDRLRRDLRDLAEVPAYGLCQFCERASEQIAAAIRVVQS